MSAGTANRFEYANAMRDLLALEIDGDAMLPDDESSYGFDNNASVLSLTPALLERYLLAARKIGRLALGDPTMRPAAATYRMPLHKVQDYREGEDLSFGTRGGSAIRHVFPLDGEYVLKIGLRRDWSSPQIRGLEKREQIDVRLDGVRVKLFEIGGECVGSKTRSAVDKRDQSDSQYGDRRMRPCGFASGDGRDRLVGVAVHEPELGQEGVGPSIRRRSGTFSSVEGGMAMDSITIEGPFNAVRPKDSPSRRQIFVCRPTGAQDEEGCAKKILGTLVRRAYRRPVTDRDVDPLLGLYRSGRRDGDFETGIQLALEGLLVSPHFLLRVERDTASVTGGRL